MPLRRRVEIARSREAGDCGPSLPNGFAEIDLVLVREAAGQRACKRAGYGAAADADPREQGADRGASPRADARTAEHPVPGVAAAGAAEPDGGPEKKYEERGGGKRGV